MQDVSTHYADEQIPEKFHLGDIVEVVPYHGRKHYFSKGVNLTGEETFIVDEEFSNNVTVHIFRGLFRAYIEKIPVQFLRLIAHREYPKSYAYLSTGRDNRKEYDILIRQEDPLRQRAHFYNIDFPPLRDVGEGEAYLTRCVEALSRVPIPFTPLNIP